MENKINALKEKINASMEKSTSGDIIKSGLQYAFTKKDSDVYIKYLNTLESNDEVFNTELLFLLDNINIMEGDQKIVSYMRNNQKALEVLKSFY